MRPNPSLSHPAFLATLLLLVLNDAYWKYTFHNDWTGKISDFAGLFAFPFLWSSVFPGRAKSIHLVTGLLFVFWKSEGAQGFIDWLNGWGVPVSRTVDYTDCIALLSVPLSYGVLKYGTGYNWKPVLRHALVLLACAAFAATTIVRAVKRKITDIDKEYTFAFSKRELIARLNMVQVREIGELKKYTGRIDFDRDRNIFHYHGNDDTLAVLLDYQQIKDQDTVRLKSTFVELLISGTDSVSTLRLLSMYIPLRPYEKDDFRDEAVKQFEQRIIRKINKLH